MPARATIINRARDRHGYPIGAPRAICAHPLRRRRSGGRGPAHRRRPRGGRSTACRGPPPRRRSGNPACRARRGASSNCGAPRAGRSAPRPLREPARPRRGRPKHRRGFAGRRGGKALPRLSAAPVCGARRSDCPPSSCLRMGLGRAGRSSRCALPTMAFLVTPMRRPISAVEWPSFQRPRSRSIAVAVQSMRFSLAETHHILWATRYGMTTRIGSTSSRRSSNDENLWKTLWFCCSGCRASRSRGLQPGRTYTSCSSRVGPAARLGIRSRMAERGGPFARCGAPQEGRRMFDLDRFAADCRAALAAGQGRAPGCPGSRGARRVRARRRDGRAGRARAGGDPEALPRAPT